MTWSAFEAGETIGTTGSEGGQIMRDDEHPAGARITVEARTTIAPFAITCGVYGVLVHTRFFGDSAGAEAACAAMKPVLAAMAVGAPEAMSADAFVELYP